MKTKILSDFGKTIKSLRVGRNLSQEELAAKTGFHRTYIGMIERGERNPSLKNISIFANSFNLEISELFRLCENIKK